MPVENVITVNFSDAEKEEVFACVNRMKEIFKGKLINLTPEERTSYGRVGKRTEDWIRRVVMWMEQNPEWVPDYLNLDEFRKDREFREAVRPLLASLSSLVEGIDDTATLVSTDVYNTALAYYRYVKLVSQSNMAGTSEIYEDLSSRFPGRTSSVPEAQDLSINN